MAEQKSGARVPPIIRAIILVALIGFLIVQGWTLLGPGGIIERHGFWDGFSLYATLSLADPVTAAGLFDMAVLIPAFAIILANGLPRGRAYPLLLAASLVILVIYPGLAALLFLLIYWRRFGQFRP